MKTGDNNNDSVLYNFYNTILAFVLIFSFFVRLPNISWGLLTFEKYGATHSFHPDEFKVMLGIKGYPKDILIRTDFRYPTALHYTLGILTTPLRMSKDSISSPLDIDVYYIIGRFGIVLIGVLSVGLTYRLGKKILSPLAGLLASGLLSVALYHVRNSALVTTDVPTSLFMVIVVLISLDIDAKSSLVSYIKLGILVGLLVGMKYTGAFVAIPVGIILFEKLMLESDWNIRRMILARLTASIFVSILIFIITTPGIILAPIAFVESLSYEFARTGKLKSNMFSYESWSYLFRTLAGSTNYLFAAFSGLGLFAGLQKNTFRNLIPYITLIILYFTYFNTSLYERYVITIMPFLCLVCANLLVNWFRSKNIFIKITGFLTAVFLFGYGSFQSIGLATMIQNDSRYQATKYIMEDAPFNSTISMGWSEADPSCSFQTNENQVVVSIGASPDYILLCGDYDLFSDGLQTLSGISSTYVEQYRLVMEYQRKYPIAVEFISPRIRIYQREDGE